MSALTHPPISPWNTTVPEGAARTPGEGTWLLSHPPRSERRTAGRPGCLVKRAVDLAGALVSLLLLWPVMLALALLIRLESPGPVLFRQVRLGHRDRPFRIFKFRTMVADSESRLGDLESCNESAGGVLFKLREDPRVTRLGRFLRRTSLDELPQLINVLRGEMSLVGPRPLSLRDSERLHEVDPAGYAAPAPGAPRADRPLASRGSERAGSPTNGPAGLRLHRESVAGPRSPHHRQDLRRGVAWSRRLLKPPIFFRRPNLSDKETSS